MLCCAYGSAACRLLPWQAGEHLAACLLPRIHLCTHDLLGVQANISTAVSAVSAALPAAAPWRFRVLSYNILADHLAHEHAAELYSSAPHFSLRWSYRSGLILRWVEWWSLHCCVSANPPHASAGQNCAATGLSAWSSCDVLCPSCLCREILHHRPDVVCLQEVDHFRQLQEELRPHG